ncbi:Rhodanese-like domain-containing protein [Xylariaceae sp. AK1471]|nr:Rhodanese-like domain-containing protein [Xylariaceae sp. AK1471]
MASIPARRLLLTGTGTGTLNTSRPYLRANTSPLISALRAAFSSASTRVPTTTRASYQQKQQLRRRKYETTPLRNGSGVRWSTTSAAGSKIWTFEEIQSLSTSPAPKPTLIDVREPAELASTGRIPHALNIPITTSPDGFHLSPQEFEDRFGFARPDKDAEVVFYCKAGVRSRAAAGIAREAGWKHVGEYPGSWIEWSGKGGEVER